MEKIKPVFTENFVPICFSANDKYVPLLSVEIASILDHSTPDKNYDIVVLTTGISDENQFNLLSQIKQYPNFSLRFVNVGPAVYGYNFYLETRLTNTKYSSEIYFRILAPSIMQDYDYVIFCDADLVVLDDIAKLLEYDYSQNLLGAVRDYEGIANCYNNNYERTKYRITELGIKSFDNYFVSGLIVLNIKKINENYSEKELLDLAVSKKWTQYDQDLLNFICKDDVKIIDAKWNFVEDIDNIYHSLPTHLLKEYEESEKNPKVIHYSGNRKPWVSISSKLNKHFWTYAENTPYSSVLKHMKNLDD
jgi:lipopolysaccharide biosynthesis glycosyltransferase